MSWWALLHCPKTGHGEPVCPCGSDHQGQFVERIGKSSGRRYVRAEIVEASAEVLDEGMAGDDHPCRTVSLQSSHRTEPCFQTSVVGLQRVVGMDVRVM